jgi:hypothetical protein
MPLNTSLGRSNNSSVASVLPCCGVLDALEQQLAG